MKRKTSFSILLMYLKWCTSIILVEDNRQKIIVHKKMRLLRMCALIMQSQAYTHARNQKYAHLAFHSCSFRTHTKSMFLFSAKPFMYFFPPKKLCLWAFLSCKANESPKWFISSWWWLLQSYLQSIESDFFLSMFWVHLRNLIPITHFNPESSTKREKNTQNKMCLWQTPLFVWGKYGKYGKRQNTCVFI